MSQTILLIGTLDTKGNEFAFARDLIETRDPNALLLDAEILGDPAVEPTFSADQVATAAGTTLQTLRDADDRGAAMDAMTTGAIEMHTNYAPAKLLMPYSASADRATRRHMSGPKTLP